MEHDPRHAAGWRQPTVGSLVVAVTLPWPPLAVKLVLEAADNVYVQVFPADWLTAIVALPKVRVPFRLAPRWPQLCTQWCPNWRCQVEPQSPRARARHCWQ